MAQDAPLRPGELQDSPLWTTSMQSLISALEGDGAGPAVARIVATFEEAGEGGEEAGEGGQVLPEKGQDSARLTAALAANRALLSLELLAAPQEVLVAVAEALKHNRTLLYLTVGVVGVVVGDETGVALANALRDNRSLQAFSFSAHGTTVGDETGLALAAALGANPVLQSFTFTADGTRVGDETSRALAGALRGNAALRSFVLHLLGANVSDEAAVAAVAGAFSGNVTLRRCELFCSSSTERFDEQARRNREAQAQRRILTALARPSPDTSFRSLAETAFRKAVLRFFLPPCCGVMPVELAGGARAAPEECAAWVAAERARGVVSEAAAAAGPAPDGAVREDAEAAAAGPGPGGAAPEEEERPGRRAEGPAEAIGEEAGHGQAEDSDGEEIINTFLTALEEQGTGMQEEFGIADEDNGSEGVPEASAACPEHLALRLLARAELGKGPERGKGAEPLWLGA